MSKNKKTETSNSEEQEFSSRVLGFNWYPGHIAKAEKQLREKISLIDMVIELVDARIPESSAHKELHLWAKDKPVLKIFSKSDIADKSKILSGIKVNSKNRNNIDKVIKEIEKQAKPINDRYKLKGLINRPFKVMIVGYPNVGKSSLINALAKKKKVQVANKPGVTRQQQWIDINSNINIKLLDTPGIIPTKFDNDDQALKLALCSCVSDKSFDSVELARLALDLIDSLYPGMLQEFYELDSLSLEALAEKKTNSKLEKAAEILINDFRAQRFAKISLE